MQCMRMSVSMLRHRCMIDAWQAIIADHYCLGQIARAAECMVMDSEGRWILPRADSAKCES